MLSSPYVQPEIYERIVRAKYGRLMRVRFVAVEIGDEILGKIISVEPVLEIKNTLLLKEGKEIILALPAPHNPISVSFSYRVSYKIPSPFFTLDFFMSQMTRAPSTNL